MKDVRKLKKILKLVPADRKDIAEKLIVEISFVAETLADLREKIKENGTVDHFKQGKQEFLRESPALKSYKRRSSVTAFFISSLPTYYRRRRLTARRKMKCWTSSQSRDKP